jgi:PTS system cellobiose-specific IIC component
MSEAPSSNRVRAFWDRAVQALEAASRQHHVVALRDGMIASVPIILVGSTFLLLGAQGPVLKAYFSADGGWLPNLVDTAFGRWYLDHTAQILFPYRVTMGLLALYIAFTIASALANQYRLAPVPQGLGAVAALLITGTPLLLKLQDTDANPQWVVALKPLGPEGIFLAIVLGVGMVELSRLILRPDRPRPAATPDSAAIPASVIDAFRSFLPILTMVSAVWFVRHVVGFDIHAGILKAMQPMTRLGDSLGAVLASNFFLHLFAVAGVHGISVINAVMLPLWQQFVAANAEAHANGLPLPHTTAYPFYQWFIWIGGAGATLPPTLLLFLSRNAHLRRIGRISLVPALFNVNEPFLFGLPVVANPLLAIPCVVAPLLCGTVAWFGVTSGLVSAPFIEVPWVMPCFLGALLSTQDLRALALLGLNSCLSAVVWWPFLKAYERRLEQAGDQGQGS